ncbi:TPA: tlde1 domain-containing protein [Photobacterium damselae]|uniref:DUF2778 domain-containing protein n=1 Tax=Photobacterium damselae subsp. damselae TaxID=85581 RepID=A0A850QRK6_PHODD|nr:DUF2778 domain-containing protein [Photobacterium damselae subsp. damselae]
MDHSEKTPCPSPTCPICIRLKPQPRKLTLSERIQKQRQDNLKASDRAWRYVQERIKNGDFLINPYSVQMTFVISARTLTVNTDCDSFTIPATSGKDEYLNSNSLESQKAGYKGVTPVGKYIIKPFEFSDPNLAVDLKRNVYDRADWGDWRVRMHNKVDEGFDFYGRNNFFLHCGQFAGSAGCIDIGGGLTGNKDTDRVAEIIKNSKTDIIVEVKP